MLNFVSGMNPATVRSDKNRKRKNGEPVDKENELNEIRETMVLLKSVVEAFGQAFPKEDTFKCWAQLKTNCEKFVTGILAFMEVVGDHDRNILIKQSLPGIAVRYHC